MMFGACVAAMSASRNRPDPKCGTIIVAGCRTASAATANGSPRRMSKAWASPASFGRQSTAAHSARTRRPPRRAAAWPPASTNGSSSEYRSNAGKRHTVERPPSSARSTRTAASGAAGLNMKAPTMRAGWRTNRDGDGSLVAGHAGDQHAALDVMTVELRDPARAASASASPGASQPSFAGSASG